VTCGRIEPQPSLDDFAYPLRNLGARRALQLLSFDRERDRRECRTAERSVAEQALPRDDAERELIASRVGNTLFEELGSHVCRRSHQRAGHRHRRVERRGPGLRNDGLAGTRIGACEAEVADARPGIFTHEHVLGLEISMHESRRMRGRESLAGLEQHLDDLAPPAGRRGEPASQRFAAHVLHRDIQTIVDGCDLEHGDDVRVGELRHRDRFAVETIVARPGAMKLECDLATERQITREIDGAHAATPEHALDHIPLVDLGIDERDKSLGVVVLRRSGGGDSVRDGGHQPAARLAAFDVDLDFVLVFGIERPLDHRHQRALVRAAHRSTTSLPQAGPSRRASEEA